MELVGSVASRGVLFFPNITRGNKVFFAIYNIARGLWEICRLLNANLRTGQTEKLVLLKTLYHTFALYMSCHFFILEDTQLLKL